ncbi:hypothetical protein RHEC894_CH01981 [Rhizobium sp. CIAT894]|nr:hypothetical protein RHEC894_CH01981 [Rhizobium sp. CIAT894]
MRIAGGKICRPHVSRQPPGASGAYLSRKCHYGQVSPSIIAAKFRILADCAEFEGDWLGNRRPIAEK